MTTDEPRVDRHPDDEPDGVPAVAASMRPPGHSLSSTDSPTADTGDDFEDPPSPTGPESAFDGPVLPGESRAGYDVDDAAGDTPAYRPE
jgi:hypothetical protein